VIVLYCDEDVDVLIKPLLEAKGLAVLTTAGEQMLGASDRQQLDHAVKAKAVFITHNRVHFEGLYAALIAEGKDHFGIIIATRKSVYEIARRVSRVLSTYTKERLKNQLLYI
jgi:hypothetical protein